MAARSLKDFLVGALVGIVSMLPGASGAIIAVVFGVYERLVADLANIRGRLLKDLRFIIPLGLGVVVGLFVCAFGLEFLLKRIETPMMFFFIGLIVCQIPDIYKMGDGDGARPTPFNIAAFVIGFLVMIMFLFIGVTEADTGITMGDGSLTSMVLMFVVGVIIAISKIVPGISGASILLAIGLYTPLMQAFTSFDVVSLIPVGVGFIVGALALSKVVDYFLKNHRRSSYFSILGLTVGSVVTVAIQAFKNLSGTEMILQSIACVVIGLLIGYGLSRISVRYAEETIQAE